jgi:hypothetical protein
MRAAFASLFAHLRTAVLSSVVPVYFSPVQGSAKHLLEFDVTAPNCRRLVGIQGRNRISVEGIG